MNDPGARVPWTIAPTAKAKTAVQRAVTALLNELAPERVVKRGVTLPTRVEQHRSPSGCVLQAATAAISVSWFANRSNDAGHGQLQITVWRGVVAQRGANENRKGATIVSELTLAPLEPVGEVCVWQSADGTCYDTASLSAKCISLLEAEIGENSGA
jgi:hypothetical protein